LEIWEAILTAAKRLHQTKTRFYIIEEKGADEQGRPGRAIAYANIVNSAKKSFTFKDYAMPSQTL
jgi:hypothetical protein